MPSRFRLRTLLIFVSLFAIYLAYTSRKADLQKRFVERVEKTGGYARYDWQYAKMAFNPDAVPPLPQWLMRVIDKNYFMRVKHVVIGETLTDSDMQWIADARCVEELEVDIDEAHELLQRIKNQKQLKYLRLRAKGELDLNFLNEMPNLEILCIDGARLRALAPVANLRALTWLRIRGCDLWDLETHAFKDMTQLTTLQIVGGDWRYSVSDQKLKEIQNYLPKCAIN